MQYLKQLNQNDFIDLRVIMKLPKALQQAISLTFPKFSMYQLGKYCSEGNRKKALRNYSTLKNPEKYQ